MDPTRLLHAPYPIVLDSQTACAAKATATIPIVFISVADPVRAGLVATLARPGGNITGLATVVPEGFVGKMIELLKEAVPRVSRVAMLINPTNVIHEQIVANELPGVAERLRLTLLTVEARAADALEGAFETAVRSRAGAIIVLGDPLIFVHRARIAELAAKHRLPAMSLFRESVEAGGLMAYVPSFHDMITTLCCLLAFATSTSAECARVLWGRSSTSGDWPPRGEGRDMTPHLVHHLLRIEGAPIRTHVFARVLALVWDLLAPVGIWHFIR